jgi:cytochrome c553
MKSPLLLMLAFAFSAPALAADVKPAPKADAAKGQAIAAQVCAACHAVDGSRGLPANPILQGQHPEYLVKQLHDFKSGARNNAIMKGFATTLGDQDMRDVAAFYASKTAKAGFATNKDSANASTAAASPTARSPPAPVATAPTARASPYSTRASAASMVSTPKRN